MEMEKLKGSLARVEDPRRTDRGNIRHRLEDILIIGLCTLICNGEDFVDMEMFGRQREEWLRTFLALPNGIPDSDTFRRVFERIAPEALSECLYDWLGCHREEGSVIAVDGKTIRGSRSESHKAYHVVSAFVAENQMVLGELVTEERSNEITAVPELLASLNIEGSIVTADAMSCQKKIAEQIRTGGAEYVIGLKGNQSTLLDDVSLYFEDFSGELPQLVTRLKDHGRIEKREYRLLTDLSWLPGAETRYFLTSLTDLEKFAYAVRSHWSVEDQLHWCLDVIFHEDLARARKDLSPLNLNVLRKVALTLCRNTDLGKRVSLQKKRFRASLDPETFLSILLGKS